MNDLEFRLMKERLTNKIKEQSINDKEGLLHYIIGYVNDHCITGKQISELVTLFYKVVMNR